MPPSRIGTYSNFTLVRCSIAGIASWLRKALGLPKSNRNWGFEVKAVSRISLAHCGLTRGARPQSHDGRNTAMLRGLARCRGAGRIWRADRVRSGRSRWFAEGEPDDVVADVIRPAGNETGEPPPVVGEQGARGFLEAGAIAGHDRHEVIGGVSGGAGAIAVAAGAARFLDQFSQCHRGAAGLGAEPFPVPRQQRHLAGDDAEFRP